VEGNREVEIKTPLNYGWLLIDFLEHEVWKSLFRVNFWLHDRLCIGFAPASLTWRIYTPPR
jgi:hypothetical protein